MSAAGRRRRAKKSETLEVRVSHPLKEALVAHCRRREMTVSDVVRELIEDRLSRETRRPFVNHERIDAMFSKLQNHPRALAGSALGSLAAMMLAVSAPSAASDGQAVFGGLDRNADQLVTREEFVSGVVDHDQRLTIREDGDTRPVSRGRLIGSAHAEFERYDRNGDGAMTFEEFSGRYSMRMREAFVFLDADENNRLTSGELAASLGGAGSALARDAVAELDQDGDETLTYREFISDGG